MRVSQSKAKLFRKCKRAYEYKYRENLTRIKKSRPLTFGGLIHGCLEYSANGLDFRDYLKEVEGDAAQVAAFQAEREMYGDILQDCSHIMTDYLDHWEGDGLRYIKRKGVRAEHHFEIELLGGEIIWNGKIDAKVQDRHRRSWLVEHKTYTRKPGDDDRWRDLQSSTYLAANEILGWTPVQGFLWDYIRSKPPALPRELQSGKLSEAKLDSLPSAVKTVIRERDEHPSSYPSLVSCCEQNRANYFSREYTPIQGPVVNHMMNQFEATAKEMLDWEEKTPPDPVMSIDRHCSWCDYEPLCRAKLQGLDHDYLKEKEYQKSAKRTEEGGDRINRPKNAGAKRKS